MVFVIADALNGNVSDRFDGDGPLIGYTTNNPNSLPDVQRSNGRYRANLTGNTNEITLHFNNDQGRLDAKLVTFPFIYIARNIGIGTQEDSQVAPTGSGGPFSFCGVQVHVTNLESRNSSHVVVGHRGNTNFTIEGKNTNNGASNVNDDGANVLPLGRADIKIEGTSDRELIVSWQNPNLTGDPANDNFNLYRGTGDLPGPTPNYGEEVYIGLITYAFRQKGIPFVGTCDSIEFTDLSGGGKTDPIVSWSNPSDIVYGVPLNASQLNATANVPGSFVYNPAAGTVLKTGQSQTLSTTFLPDNISDFNIVEMSASINVIPANLTLIAISQTRAYGEDNVEFTVSGDGFVGNDSIDSLDTMPSVVTLATKFSLPGEYNLSISGAQDANYNIEYTSGLLTIEPALLTLVADNLIRGFNQFNPELTISSTGFALGENFSDLEVQPTINTEALPNSPLGVYEIQLSGASDDRYTITHLPGQLEVVTTPMLERLEWAQNGSATLSIRSTPESIVRMEISEDLIDWTVFANAETNSFGVALFLMPIIESGSAKVFFRFSE